MPRSSRGHTSGKRFLLYAAVSGVATIITQVVLATLHGVVGWRASVSNIIAVCVATPVSYYMNRAWVWGKRGRSKIGKEVAPFWAFSIAGLFLSTLLVGLVAVWQGLPTGQKPTVFQQLQINAANVVGFAHPLGGAVLRARQDLVQAAPPADHHPPRRCKAPTPTR